MGRADSASSSSSSIDSNNKYSTSSFSHLKRDLTTDLRLGLNISASHQQNNNNPSNNPRKQLPLMETNEAEGNENTTLYVKVYMEGHPIGRKLDVLSHDGYEDLIATLDHMFNTNVLWGAELDAEHCADFHVLTYEDEEGDWMIVGDVPWEMFLSAVRRLKISRAFPC